MRECTLTTLYVWKVAYRCTVIELFKSNYVWSSLTTHLFDKGCFALYASAANNRRREALRFSVISPSVRPLSVNTSFAWREFSSLSGGISLKLGIIIQHVTRLLKRFSRSARSKVIVFPNCNIIRIRTRQRAPPVVYRDGLQWVLTKKMQNWVKGVTWGSRDPLLDFWYPLISQERLKLETSNLTQRRMAVSTNEKMQNWVKRCHVGSRNQFWIFGTP